MRLCLLLFAICCLACAGGGRQLPNNEFTADPNAEPIEIATFRKEVEQDWRVIAKKYEGKTLRVSGWVLNIPDSRDGLPVVKVWDRNKASIMCKCLEQERYKVRRLNLNQHIVIVGNLRCSEDEFELYNCILAQSP